MPLNGFQSQCALTLLVMLALSTGLLPGSTSPESITLTITSDQSAPLLIAESKDDCTGDDCEEELKLRD